MKSLNSLGALLDKLDLKTASSEKTKVIANPTRQPVNRQAFRVMLPAPWWAKPFPPEEDLSKKETVTKLLNRAEELRVLLVKEREASAAQAKLVANLRQQLRSKKDLEQKFTETLVLKEAQITELTKQVTELAAVNKQIKEMYNL